MQNTLTRNKVMSGLFWTYSERISAQLVSFVVTIVLARMIAPEQFGVITLVNVFISIANVFVSDSFGNALIRKKEANATDFSTVFFIDLFVSVGLYIILFFSAPYIARFYREPQVTKVLRVLSIKIILAAWNSVQNAYVSRQMQFKKFFFATLLGTVISAVVGIVMVYMGFGVWALVAQYLTNSLIDTIVLSLTCGWKPQVRFSKKSAIELGKYGGELLFAQLIQTIYDNIRSLIIGKQFTTTELSYYDRGKRFPALIVDNINASITKTLFPVLSKVQDDKERLLQMTRRSVKISAFLLAPLLGGLIACGENIIRIILTGKWIPAVPYMRIIALTYLFMPLHKANLQAIKALGRSDIILKMEYVKKAFGISFVVIATYIFKSPIAIAWSFFASTLVNALVNGFPNISLLGYKAKDQILDIVPIIFCALVMVGGVSLINLTELTSEAKLLLQIPIGAIVYCVMSKVTKIDSLEYFCNMIKGFIKKRRFKKFNNEV